MKFLTVSENTNFYWLKATQTYPLSHNVPYVSFKFFFSLDIAICAVKNNRWESDVELTDSGLLVYIVMFYSLSETTSCENALEILLMSYHLLIPVNVIVV